LGWWWFGIRGKPKGKWAQKPIPTVVGAPRPTFFADATYRPILAATERPEGAATLWVQGVGVGVVVVWQER